MVKIKPLMENTPLPCDWIVLGKFMIHKTLLNQNILLLKYAKSYAPIPWLRRTKIDNIFKDFWLELLHTKTVSYGLLKQCSLEQVNLVNDVIVKSKVNISFDKTKAIMSPEDIVERLQILQGELDAGNNNTQIITEAKNIINKLYSIKKITENEKNELLNELNTF